MIGVPALLVAELEAETDPERREISMVAPGLEDAAAGAAHGAEHGT